MAREILGHLKVEFESKNPRDLSVNWKDWHNFAIGIKKLPPNNLCVRRHLGKVSDWWSIQRELPIDKLMVVFYMYRQDPTWEFLEKANKVVKEMMKEAFSIENRVNK